MTSVCSVDGKRFYKTSVIHEKVKGVPIYKMDARELTHVWDAPRWDPGVSMLDVLCFPEKYPDHVQRIKQCDLGFPILLYKSSHGHVCVLDGAHRIMKCHANGVSILSVQYVSDEILGQAFYFEEG